MKTLNRGDIWRDPAAWVEVFCSECDRSLGENATNGIVDEKANDAFCNRDCEIDYFDWKTSHEQNRNPMERSAEA